MRFSLKTKQVAGVTALVGIATFVLSLIYLAYITGLGLNESQSRGVLLTNAIFQQAQRVVTGPQQAREALRRDPGIRSVLESAIAYSSSVTYAAIVDTRNVAIAHSSPSLEGQVLEPQATLSALLYRNLFAQLRVIYSDRIFEVQQPLLLGDEQFGSIRIGLSTIFVREELETAMTPAIFSAVVALGASMFGAMLLAQWLLRPIHVIQSGLTRLQQGEFDVKLDLPPGDEFAELGKSFDTVSAELSSVRSQLAGQSAQIESVVDRLEDAVAIIGPDGEVAFSNAAMHAFVGQPAPEATMATWLADEHPFTRLVDAALATRRSQGPRTASLSVGDADREVELLVTAHVIEGAEQRFMGVMLLARNVGYLSQVQSTLQYSRKLASLGRLLTGVAHEVKNPLNAMTIHLELLKQKLMGTPSPFLRGRRVPAAVGVGAEGPSARGESVLGLDAGSTSSEGDRVLVEVPAAMSHVKIIGEEIHRLDEVVQGFLKFSRPEELSLEPIALRTLVDEVLAVVGPQAQEAGVTIVNECSDDLPPVRGDQAMLRQALLNLAINACQAMPKGGSLRLAAAVAGQRRIMLTVEDTGAGIPPEHLERVFDLYFTTKEGGSGIGLSMVYRTVQLHDGHIEVQSTIGHGTTFRLYLPQDRRREPRVPAAV